MDLWGPYSVGSIFYICVIEHALPIDKRPLAKYGHPLKMDLDSMLCWQIPDAIYKLRNMWFQ